MPGLPYGDVQELYQILKDNGQVTNSLSDWSQEQNARTDSDLFSEGVNDNLIKRTSYGIDQLLEKSGLPELTGRAGEYVGGLIGNPEYGRAVGHGFPRMVVDVAPSIAGAALAPLTGGLSAYAGTAATAGLMGAGTYQRTGSIPAGFLAGGLGLVLPKVGQLGTELGWRAAGVPLIKGAAYEATEAPLAALAASQGIKPAVEIAERVPTNLWQGAAGLTGANVAMYGAQQVGAAGEAAITGQPYHISPTSALLDIASTGPFMALHLTKGGRAALGGRTSRERAAALTDSIDIAKAAQEAVGRTEETQNKAPDDVYPETDDLATAENVTTNATINDTRATQAGLKEEGTTLGDEQRARVAEKDQELGQTQGVQPGNVFGAQMDENTTRRNVTGKLLDEASGHRFLQVDDNPANGDLAGKVIGWNSAMDPKDLPEGQFAVPEGYHAEYGVRDNGTLDVDRALDNVNKAVDVAKTDGDLSGAVYAINGVKAKYNQPLVDDVEISNRIETGEAGDPRAAIRAIVNETRNLVRADNEATAAKAATPPAEPPVTGATTASVPVMITKRMEADLLAKGFSQDQINKMTPAEAHGNLAPAPTETAAPPEGVVKPAGITPPTEPTGTVTGDIMTKLQGSFKDPAAAKIFALQKEHRNRPKFFRDRLLNLIETDPAVAAKLGQFGDVEALKAELRTKVIPGLGDTFREIDQLPRGDSAEGRPITQILKEQLIKIAHGTPHVEDAVKLMDYVTMGRSAMLKKYGITKRDLSEWIREPHVADWAGQLRDVLGQKQQSAVDYASKPFVPINTTEKALVSSVGNNGRSALRYLQTQSSEKYANLARHFEKYLPLLDKVRVRYSDSQEPAEANLYGAGDVEIVMPGHTMESKTGFDNSLMHEMLHALTLRQIHQPWNSEFNDALTRLREHVAKQMPEDIRGVAQRAIETKWLERRARGETNWSELYPSGEAQSVKDKVYALLDNHEFITQAFTSGFINDLTKIRGIGGGTARDSFIKWTGKLLNKDLSSSALSELWNVTGKTVKLNNYVATVQSYTQRYFENQGMTPDQANALSGHVAKIARMGGSRQFDANYVVNEVMKAPSFSAETKNAANELQDFLAKAVGGDDSAFAKFLAVSEAASRETGIGTLGSDSLHKYVKDVLTGDRAVGDELKILDPAVTNYVYSAARDVRNVLGAVNGMLDPKVAPYVEGAEKFNRDHIGTLLGRAGSIMEHEAAFVEAEKTWKAMSAVSPEGMVARYAADVPANDARVEIAQAATERDPTKQRLNIFERFLGNGAFLARIGGRATKELVTKINQLGPNKKEMLLAAEQAMGLNLGDKSKFGPARFTAEQLKHYEDPTIRKPASKWMFENIRVAGETDGAAVKLDRSSSEVQALLRTVPPSKWDAIEGLVDKGIAMNKVQAASILAKQTNIAALNGAALLSRFTGKNAEFNFQTMTELLRLAGADPADPAVAARLQEMQARLGPEAYKKMADYAVRSNQMLQMQAEFNEANPAWVTTTRYGTWDLHYAKGGQVLFDRVNSEKEGRVLAAERGGRVVSLARNNQNEDIPTTFKVQNLDRLRELEEAQFKTMEEVLGAGTDEMKELRASSIVDAMEADLRLEGEKRGLTTNIPKKFKRGEEEVDFVRNQLSWLDRGSSFWTREQLRAQARAWLKDPEIVARPDIQGRLKKLVENVMQRDPGLATEMRRFAASWFMGFSPASAMANATQIMTRIASEFTARTGNPLKSWGMVMDSIKTLAQETTKKPAMGSDEEWVKSQMLKDDTGAIYYEEDPTNRGLEDLQNVMARKGVQTLGQKLSQLHSGQMDKILFFFRMVEKMNNFVATRASFKLFREQGMDRQQAYDEAKLLNQFVNDSGGKAARSIGMFAGRDDFSKNAALMSSTLQTYFIGSTRQMATWLKYGNDFNPKVTPSEKYYGKLAFAQLMATQFALAGTMGLPFVSGALGVINQVFPELEVHKNIKKWTNKLFTGDEESGNVLSDTAAIGIPSMFGWDSQSRLSMGNIPGANEYNGFDAGGIIGPLPSVAVNAVKGVRKMMQGDYLDGATQILPPFLKKTIKMVADGGKIRDYNDKPIITPTGGEMAGMVLGFNPKRLRDFNDSQRISSQAKKMEDEQTKRKNGELADNMANGRFDVVNQFLLEQKKKDPAFDLRKRAQTIVDQTTEIVLPRDLRRGGAGEEYAKALRIMHYKPSAEMPTEMERQQLKMRLLMNLGVRPDPASSRTSVNKAVLMDSLREQNPDASRYELQRMAERLQRRMPGG